MFETVILVTTAIGMRSYGGGYISISSTKAESASHRGEASELPKIYERITPLF